LVSEDAALEFTAALQKPHSEESLVWVSNINITRRLFAVLNMYVWLNDEIINSYMLVLKDRNDKLWAHNRLDPNSKFRRSYFFSNFFIDKLLDNEYSEYRYAYVCRWSRKFDIFAYDKIFCPANIDQQHWTLTVIFMQQKTIVYYDSMGDQGRRYVDGLFRYVQDEHQDKKGVPPPNPEEWTLVYGSRDGCPQQQNGFDCGVYACVCADYLSDDLPLIYTQEDITNFWRTKIGVAILNNQLDY
jgi:sentrin-specific protease 1